MTTHQRSTRGASGFVENLPHVWERLLDGLPNATALVDERGLIRYANKGLVSLSGYSRENLVGLALDRLIRLSGVPTSLSSGEGRVGFTDHLFLYQLPPQEPRDVELTLVRHHGGVLPVTVEKSSVTLTSTPWTLVEIRDNRLQREVERDLRDNLQRFRLAFDHNMAPMSIADRDDRPVAVNQAFTDLVGFSEAEILGSDTRLFTHPDDVGITEANLQQVRTTGADQVRYLKRYRHKDGHILPVEISRSAARDAKGNLLYFVFSGRDISDRVSRENFLELLAAVNALAVRASNERELLTRVSEVLVDVGGYPLAWIGATSRTVEGDVDILAAAGAKDYLYEGIVSSRSKSRRGLGPAGRALRTGETQIMNDLSSAPNFAMWRQRAHDFKLASSVAIPFKLGSRQAVVNLYSSDVKAFDPMTVQGLEDLLRETELAMVRIHSITQAHKALAKATNAVSALSTAENALSESEQRFRLAFEDNMSPMIFNDLEDRAIAVNDAFCEMVGFSREELLGQDSKIFTHPDDVGITERTHERLVKGEITQARYVKRYMRKDGVVVISEVSRSAARDAEGRILYFVASERDVTEERALTAQLSTRALHDPLTGLANRTLFEDRMSHAFVRSARSGGLGAVLLLDLDDFKGVNDTHGHATGDQLLVSIAHRFEKITRSSDTLGRFGGDEFLYLAEDLTSPEEAIAIAERLQSALGRRFDVNGQDVEQRASIGIVLWDGSESTCDEFIQNADVAMYHAKRQGKGCLAIFAPEMREQVSSDFELLQELRHAIEVGELTMHYQPIVRLDTLDIVGFEALMRWKHPVRGMVAPNVFIPLAEQSDLIFRLGEFALEQAVTAASTWRATARGADLPYVTVNLSARQFQDPNLARTIEEALAGSGLSPERLIIEITESVTLLDVAETSGVVERLSALGVDFALDDFGTGYSSLSYLADLNPKIIKIDQSFVNPCTSSERTNTLLEAIISLGHRLDGTMLGEGIETSDQLKRLRDLRCELGQGYFFSPAVSADQIATLIEETPWRSSTRGAISSRQIR